MADNEMKQPAGQQMPGSRAGSVLNLIIGLWLIISPFIYSSFATAAKRNDLYTGLLILLFSIVGLTLMNETWSKWINVILGLWLIVSPFVLGFASSAMALWTDLILGILVVVFSLWGASASAARRKISPQYR